MMKFLSALVLFVSMLYVVDLAAQPMQPKGAPKMRPKPDPYVGTWNVVGKNLKYEEQITVLIENGQVKLTGFYKLNGNQVGSFHGEKIGVAITSLHFTVVVDEKPPFEVLSGTRCWLSLSEDKDKATLRSLTPATTTMNPQNLIRPFERVSKAVAVVVAPKTVPKIDPQPQPKVEPKTSEPEKPVGPYSVIATVKSVYSGALSPDGKFLYALNIDGNSKSLVSFDLAKKEVVKRINLEFPNYIRISDDGKRLAVVDYINFGKQDYFSKIYVYDTQSWETVAEFDHPLAVSHLSISSDGGRFAVASGNSGSSAGVLKVWDVAKKKAVLTAPTGNVFVIAMSSDGKTIVKNNSSQDKRSIGFFDVNTGRPKVMLNGLAERLAISADGKFAVGAHGNRLAVYDAVKRTVRALPPAGVGAIETIALVDNNRRVLTSGGFTESLMVALDTGKAEKPFVLSLDKKEKISRPALAFQAQYLCPTPDSSLLLTVGSDRVARVWTLPFSAK